MAEKTPTPTIEDYLGIIYTLERDGEIVFGARLSKLLEVSAPTVTVTLHRMVRDGWIKVDKAKKIQLTPAGVTAAKKTDPPPYAHGMDAGENTQFALVQSS